VPCPIPCRYPYRPESTLPRKRRLEQLADGTTEFTESEVFTGPAAPGVIGGQLPELHAAYQTFAAAFKKRVEEPAS
jgi:hypothetical protein